MSPERSLRERLAGLGRTLVAFSGGVDSAVLAFEARSVLGPARMLAVTAVSPSFSARDRDAARAFAAAHTIPHLELETTEMDDPGYRANAGDRCYFCKRALFSVMETLAAERGFDTLAYGENADDDPGDRPGSRAAREFRVAAPLREAGLGKSDVRALAAHHQLSVWDRPASPCLASRIPVGTPVNPQLLSDVERAELVLHGLGLPENRVRHEGTRARIEVPLHAFDTVAAHRAEIDRAFRQIGFGEIVLDLGGLHAVRAQGSLSGSRAEPTVVAVADLVAARPS